MIRPAEIGDWWLDHRVDIQARAIEALAVVSVPPAGWALWRGWHEARAAGIPAGVWLATLGVLVAYPLAAVGHAAVRNLAPLTWADRWSACHPRAVASVLHEDLVEWLTRSHKR